MKYLKYFENIDEVDPFGEEDWDEEEKKIHYYLGLFLSKNKDDEDEDYWEPFICRLDNHYSDQTDYIDAILSVYVNGILEDDDLLFFRRNLFYENGNVIKDKVIEFNSEDNFSRDSKYFIFLSEDDVPKKDDVYKNKDIIETIIRNTDIYNKPMDVDEVMETLFGG